MQYTEHGGTRVPIWFAETEDVKNEASFMDPPVLDLMVENEGVTFRGVTLDRLPMILRDGVDVDPTDSLIYCDDLEKALEYGDVVMAFRFFNDDRKPVLRSALACVFHGVTSDEDAVALESIYPHVLQTTDRVVKRARFISDNCARMRYIRDYGHFIPGDPWQALVGIFVYGNADTLQSARDTVERAVRR